MKRNLMRSLSLALVLALMLGIFAGCDSEKPDGSTGGTTGPAAEPTDPLPTGELGEIFTQYGDSDTLYLNLAKFAVDDLIENFWVGDLETGRVIPTHTGAALDLNNNGVIWECGMVLYSFYDLWVITGDEKYEKAITAEANYFRTAYSAEQLEDPAGPPGPATDDCAWTAMLLMIFYDVTGDEWFLERTINLLDNVRDRWYDEELGGLYYKDGVDYMSSYECGITLTWLRLWEITGEQRFYDMSLASYENMHKRMVWDEGLYFIECNKYWPTGDKKSIGEGASSSSLFGNMAMATLSAKFYKITGEQKYLDRVYATNEGLLKRYNNGGVLLNDRDAWTNGTFASYYASNVLTLEGTEEMQKLLLNTAKSIMCNDRTDKGTYGGSWQGPAEGDGSVWHLKGSTADQAHTSGSTVMLVTAAAILEAGIEDFAR